MVWGEIMRVFPCWGARGPVWVIIILEKQADVNRWENLGPIQAGSSERMARSMVRASRRGRTSCVRK